MTMNLFTPSRASAVFSAGLVALEALCVAGALVLAAPVVAAQGRTWIVDAANGPGTDFTNLPPAFSAAADGDQIWVRAGSYASATTAKALTVLGISGPWYAPRIEVLGLPAGRDFVLQGFHSTSTQPQVVVRDCAGRVLLDRPNLSPPSFQLTYATPAIDVRNCALVTVQEGVVTGYPAVAATGSTLHVVDSDLNGGNSVLTFTYQASQPGIRIQGGRLDVTNSRLRGGNGLAAAQPQPPSAALITDSCALRIAGDPQRARLSAGTGASIPTPVLRGTLGTLRIDPNVPLVPYLAPAIAGTITVQSMRLPALHALGAPPGGVVHVDLFAPVGDLAAAFVGRPGDLLPLPAFGGELGIDPALLLHVLSGSVAPTGHFEFHVGVPNNPSLRGVNWVWQSLSGNLQGGFLLSNRANYVNN